MATSCQKQAYLCLFLVAMRIEIINNTRGGIESEIWERGDWGANSSPGYSFIHGFFYFSTSNNGEENFSYRFLLLLRWLLRKHQFDQLALGPTSGTGICPPIAAFPFVFTEEDYDAPSSVIYNLYGNACEFDKSKSVAIFKDKSKLKGKSVVTVN